VPLIFVFTHVSSGLSGAILAEFAPVPNASSDVDPTGDSAAIITAVPAAVPAPVAAPSVPKGAGAQEKDERGGPAGPEPTRFGDWERNGRCIDF